MNTPRVLDPCCGSRMMWFDRQHPDAVFGDKRRESHVLCDGRQLHIQPDTVMDFLALPFADGSFHLVVFDPPHLKHAGPRSWLRAKYGVLGESWREIKSIEELAQVIYDDLNLSEKEKS